jgi:hypothetical protein
MIQATPSSPYSSRSLARAPAESGELAGAPVRSMGVIVIAGEGARVVKGRTLYSRDGFCRSRSILQRRDLFWSGRQCNQKAI